MNIIDQALDELAAALAEVAPGRVTATPRTDDVGPAVWIDVPTTSPDRVPQTRHVNADFPVWVTADGADRAQVAYLNDVTAKVYDAVERLRHSWVLSTRPVTADADQPRAVIITVRRLIAARGFCLPDPPGGSPIPPDPIDPITPEPSEEI